MLVFIAIFIEQFISVKETLTSWLKSHINLISNSSIATFSSIATYKKYEKGDIVISTDRPTSKFYIIASGLVGNYTTNEKGKQLIKTLYTKNKAFGALASYIKRGVKSDANFQCLTDCEVYEIDCNDFTSLKKVSTEFELIYDRILEKSYLKIEQKIDEICLLSSNQRLQKLKKEIPNIDTILPQYQIAYYLNITPVQLSRIKNNYVLN